MESDIKVAARIRPPIQTAQAREDVCLYALPQTNEIVLANQMSFYVDYALPMECDQSHVFDTVIQKRVDHMLQGYDVSFIAYGHANSGKTYTILGPSLHCALSETKYGILPRAAREIFNKLLTFRQHYGIQFSVSVSFVEIFNEETRDLLSTSQCNNNNSNLYFRTDEKGLTTLAGVEEIMCQNVGEVFNCIRVGMNARQITRTHKNPASSLSHCVVVLKVKQKRFSNRGRTEVRSSQALFVDLAGSEQVFVMSPTGSLQATQQTVTNTGLGVISAIIASFSGQWLPSSPFTQSLLFPILKDSFIGTMKTLLICCISPSSSDYSETLNSLRLIDHIHMLNKYTFVRDDVASSNCRNDNNSIRSDSFGLEFAASQWLKLVSNAEGLFNKLVNNDNRMPEGTREQIEEWLCLKQECEECLVAEESKTNNHQRYAGKSLERIEEVTETDTKSQSDSGNSTSSLDSDDEDISESKCHDEQDDAADPNGNFDEDDIFEFEEEIAECAVNDNLDESKICVGKEGPLSVVYADNVLEKLEVSIAKFKNITDELIAESMKENCNKKIVKETESTKTTEMSYLSRRRKSILPGENTGLLPGLPPQRPSEMIDEGKEYSSSSDEDKSLEIPNNQIVSKEQKLVVKKELEKPIEQQHDKELEKSKSSRGFGTESENDEKFKWIAEEEARLVRLQESSQKLQEQLDIKQVSLEKREQFLKEKLSQEKVTNVSMLFASDRLSHLEQVLKNKSSSFEETAVDAKEVLRHEIRNLRKTKDYLMEKRRNLDTKFNKDKVLTQVEERKFLECDEAIEAIDATIEYKNEVLCGGSCELMSSDEREKTEEMLIARVMKLSLMETKSLLCKYFKKVVDLRESGRKLETQITELDRQSAAQAWKIQELSHTLKQARLEYEKRLIGAQKDHQEKIHLLFRHYADELSSVNSGGDDSDRCCRQNKALKQRLLELEAMYKGRGGGASASPSSHHNFPAKIDDPRPSDAALVACQPSIPQHNLKRLQGSASSSSTNTKVTVFKNKLVIQKQDKDKKKQAK